MLQHGDVRWYRFRAPDKTRPVLILTRSSAIDFLAEITIAPITSTVHRTPSEVILTGMDGMPRDCAVYLDHLQTVPKGRIGAAITTLSEKRMSAVRAALLFAIGFEREPGGR